jgi:hypothetical protein
LDDDWFLAHLGQDGDLSDHEAARLRAAGIVAAWVRSVYPANVDSLGAAPGEPVRSARALTEATTAADAEAGTLQSIEGWGDGGCATLHSDDE